MSILRTTSTIERGSKMLSLEAQTISRAVGQIYEAARDEKAWADALELLARMFGSAATYLIDVDLQGKTIRRPDRVGMDPRALEEFDAHYIKNCPRLSFHQANPSLRIYYDHLHTPEHEMDRHEYYDWLSRFKLRHYFALRVSRDLSRPLLLTFHRHRSSGHVTPREIELAKMVLPHVERAMRITNEVQHSHLKVSALEYVPNGRSFGTVIVDPNLKILHIDAKGERLLGADDGFCTRRGYLETVHPRDHHALRKAVAAAANFGADVTSAWQTSVMIRRASGSSPYEAVVTPLSSLSTKAIPSQPMISIHILSRASLVVDARLVSQQLRLTAPEAEIACALASGESLAEYAARRHRSVHTIRGHLKRAMSKTGTSRQTELVHRVLSSLRRKRCFEALVEGGACAG